jgi:hypothetical protein
MAYQIATHRFLQNLVHSTLYCFFNVSWLCVTCHCCDDRLHASLRVQKLSNLLSGLVPIDKWHVTVHKDQVVAATLVERNLIHFAFFAVFLENSLLLLDVFFDLVDSFLSIERGITKEICIEPKLVFHYNFQSFNIEALIVNN